MKKFKEIKEKATPEERAKLSLKHAQEKEKLVQTHKAEKERMSQQENTEEMTPKQQMKFDQLMKKLDGGKEHMKFKRTAKTPVQGDDMFHGYVKDLAMKEQTEIVEYTIVSPKMAKVFDSLKVGDKFTYKTKRYSSDGLKVTKKEILRGNLAGVERITVGKGGVYLFKWEKTKELVMRSGNMPITITDLMKESMNETVQVNEVQGSDYDFSPIQLSRLKKAYSTVKRIDPTSQNYKKLKKAISKLHANTLEQIAREKIRFVSVIAADEYAKKSGKRLHARDYMESTDVAERKLTDGELKKREEVAKAMEKDSPDMPMGKKMAIATAVAKGSKTEDVDEAKVLDNMSQLPKGIEVWRPLKSMQQVKKDADLSGMEITHIVKNKQGNKVVAAVVSNAKYNFVYVNNKGVAPLKEETLDEASAYADARRAFKRDDKRGLASLKKDTDDDSATDSDKKAANKNIIMQLRKAADLPNGAEVIFPSGKKKVDRRTAQQMLVKFNSLKKSFEKDAFQKSIKSLADIKKILGR
jgi:hypothetical protein